MHLERSRNSSMYLWQLMNRTLLLRLPEKILMHIVIGKSFIQWFFQQHVMQICHDASVLRSSELFVKSDDLFPPGFYLLGCLAFPLPDWPVTPFIDFGSLKKIQRPFWVLGFWRSDLDVCLDLMLVTWTWLSNPFFQLAFYTIFASKWMRKMLICLMLITPTTMLVIMQNQDLVAIKWMVYDYEMA